MKNMNFGNLFLHKLFLFLSWVNINKQKVVEVVHLVPAPMKRS